MQSGWNRPALSAWACGHYPGSSPLSRMVAPGDFRGSWVAGLRADGVLGPRPGLGAPRGDEAHWWDEVTSCRAASGRESWRFTLPRGRHMEPSSALPLHVPGSRATPRAAWSAAGVAQAPGSARPAHRPHRCGFRRLPSLGGDRSAQLLGDVSLLSVSAISGALQKPS